MPMREDRRYIVLDIDATFCLLPDFDLANIFRKGFTGQIKYDFVRDDKNIIYIWSKENSQPENQMICA